jgi:type II secretory pathway pseudopilin PulG
MEHTKNRGMTLLETMVWVGVLLAAMIALSNSLIAFYHTNAFIIRDATIVSSAQHAMDTAVRAVRSASYSNLGAYPVISISPSQMSFYSHVSTGNSNIQQVRIFTQGTALMEGVIEPQGDPPAYTSTEVLTTLSNYVLNASLSTTTFSYYDQNGTLITDYSKFQNVRFVTISLIVDTSTTTLPTQLTLTESAALRNLITH